MIYSMFPINSASPSWQQIQVPQLKLH